MSFRIENKYQLEINKLSNFYKFLNDNSANIIYPKRFITSVYFDNQSLTAYNDSIEGVTPRKKIRVRSYPDYYNLKKIKKFNLEIKINSVEGKFKINQNDIDFKKIIKNGYYDSSYGLCFPNVEVSYFREYFSVFNVRITLDISIVYKEFNKKKIIPYNKSIIVEVKSNNLDNNNHIESKIHFQKIRFSKYCNAIESVNNLF